MYNWGWLTSLTLINWWDSVINHYTYIYFLVIWRFCLETGFTHQRIGLPVAKGAIPEERKVNPLKLGKTQVLPPPGLDILHPVNTNWTSQDMSKAENMELLKSLPWLWGKSQESSPLLCPLWLSQGEVKLLFAKMKGGKVLSEASLPGLAAFPTLSTLGRRHDQPLAGNHWLRVAACCHDQTHPSLPAMFTMRSFHFKILAKSFGKSDLQDSI